MNLSFTLLAANKLKIYHYFETLFLILLKFKILKNLLTFLIEIYLHWKKKIFVRCKLFVC